MHNTISFLEPLTPEDYAAALRVLKGSTRHIEQICDFFEKKILPQAKSRKQFLDIGPGDGTLTKRLSPYFDKTTVVEPNPALHSLLKSSGFALFPCVFEKATLLPDQFFDFILMSHLFTICLVLRSKRNLTKHIVILQKGARCCL